MSENLHNVPGLLVSTANKLAYHINKKTTLNNLGQYKENHLGGKLPKWRSC